MDVQKKTCFFAGGVWTANTHKKISMRCCFKKRTKSPRKYVSAREILSAAVVNDGTKILVDPAVIAHYLEMGHEDESDDDDDASPVLTDLEVVLLASVVAELPIVGFKTPRRAFLPVIHGFFKRIRASSSYGNGVYLAFLRWLSEVSEEGLSAEVVYLTRFSMLKQTGESSEIEIPALKYVGTLFSSSKANADDVEALLSQVPPARAFCVAPELAWSQGMGKAQNSACLEKVLCAAWSMQDTCSSLDAATTCMVCLDVRRMFDFAVLTCGHVICVECVARYRRVCTPAPAWANTATFRCPKMCQYNCIALPACVYARESFYVQTLHALNEKMLEAHPQDMDWVPGLRVGDQIQVRVAGGVKTWVDVDMVISCKLVRACDNTGFPIFILTRGDVILDVVRRECDRRQVSLSVEDIERVAKHAQHSITYASRAGKDVRHFHRCFPGADKWVRVRSPARVDEVCELWYDGDDEAATPSGIKDIHEKHASTHVVLPTMLSSACRCTEILGFSLAVNVCMKCKRFACTFCFSGVVPMCAFCKACDSMNPSSLAILERI